MVKAGNVEIPSMEVDTTPEVEAVEDAPKRRGRPVKSKVEVDVGDIEWVTIKVPIAKSEDIGYCVAYSEMRLTAAEARRNKQIMLGFQRAGVLRGSRLEPITSTADIYKYILSQI